MLRMLISCFLIVGGLSAVEIRVATFNVGADFSDRGFPVHGLGDEGTEDYNSVRDTLRRIDADVVALQEIHAADVRGAPDDLDSLAADLGMPYQYQAKNEGTFDTSLRVVFLSRFPFSRTEDITSPPGAKELTRNLPVVRVDVPGTSNDPTLISAHLKAGTDAEDRFRRAVEMQRLARWLAAENFALRENYIILGDLNLSGQPREFREEPSGLPRSYDLGEDLSFPVDYSRDPEAYFTETMPEELVPLQQNGDDATNEFVVSGGFVVRTRPDRVLISPGFLGRDFRTEIYDSEQDESNQEGLSKAGEPLAASVSEAASDHFAIFGDLELDDEGEFSFQMAGDTVKDDFDDFTGRIDPFPWEVDERRWLGKDDGTSPTPGARAYGRDGDFALGFLGGSEGVTASVRCRNDSDQILDLLDVRYVAEQWRAASDGALDRVEVELEAGGTKRSLGQLGFVARTQLSDGAIMGGVAAERETRVRGLNVGSGEEFALHFKFVRGEGSAGVPTDVFVNEIHYDNEGRDEGEFIEVVVAPGFAGELSDVELVFYNGNEGTVYETLILEDLQEGVTTNSGHRLFSINEPGIQNGSPDGLAVVVDGMVTSFLSYEGMMEASEGPAMGMMSIDIGVEQGGGLPGESALARVGRGGRGDDFVWERLDGVMHSPGEVNEGQEFTIAGLPPAGLAVDDVELTFVRDTDRDGKGDDEDIDDDSDGMPDPDELAFGSDPLNADDRFTVEVIATGNDRRLRFPAASDMDYYIESSGDLVNWKVIDRFRGTGGRVEMEIPATNRRRFYRVKVD